MYTEAGPASLFIVNADGTNLLKLADVDNPGEKDFWGIYYSWLAFSLSPDQRRVAYFSSTDYLSILDINDGQVTRVKEVRQELGDMERYVAWSPDGSRIAYVSDGDLFLTSVDGTDDKELAYHQGGQYVSEGWISDQIRRPVWSADGKRIFFDDFTAPVILAFGNSPKHPLYRAVYAVDIASSEISEVFDTGQVGCQVPLGTRLLVKGESRLFLVNDDGTAFEEFSAQALSVGDLVMMSHIRWSPDGSAITYISQDSGQLLEMDANTREAIPLEPGAKLWRPGVWSPDSQHIAYVGEGEGAVEEIYIGRHDLSCGFLVYRLSDTTKSVALVAWIK